MHSLLHTRRDSIAELCRRFRVRELSAFGSVLRTDFDTKHSDVDLVADFDPPSDGDLVSQYFDLKEQLEQLLDRKVDLVERKAVRNSYLREEIEATRVPLYVTH